jgi:hypothetical protein
MRTNYTYKKDEAKMAFLLRAKPQGHVGGGK